MSRNQVTNGLTWIRETAAAEHLTPLTYTRAEGYRFSGDPNDWFLFERGQLLRMLTSIKRTLSGVVTPHAMVLPDDAVARWGKG